MIKKVYGINDKNEQIELDFKKFLIITDNDSNLTIDTATQNHPESPDLVFYIDSGPTIPDESRGENCRIALEGHRYFSISAGACDVMYLKVVRMKPTK
jgi:hypothetical protein